MDEEVKENSIEWQSGIPDFAVSALRESFPRETHETKRLENGFETTGIKPAYVIERLNQVLGLDGWDYNIEEEMITEFEALAKITVNMYIIDKTTMTKILVASRTQWGGNPISNKKSLSDAKKGAITNAICKAVSLFDVAHEAYKGLLPPVEEEEELITDEEVEKAEKVKKTKAKTSKKSLEDNEEGFKSAKKELAKFFVDHGLDRGYLVELMEKNFGKQESRDLTTKEVKHLLSIVKEKFEQSPSPSSEDSKDSKEKDGS